MASRFYKELTTLSEFSDILDGSRYTAAPDDWHVVVADIRGSTRAIEAGRYKDVNILGVAAITGVTNACGSEIPYVFGGDGATLLVPDSDLAAARSTLVDLVGIATSLFSLEMRAGSIPVSHLRTEGHDVRVCKYAPSEDVSQAMFAGGGLAEADRLMKVDESPWCFATPATPTGDGDFAGLECRWQPIHSQNGAMVSLLVKATDEQQTPTIYGAVWQRIADLAGDDEMRPIGMTNAQFAEERADYEAETKVRTASGPDTAEFKRYQGKAHRLTRVGHWLTRLKISLGGFDGRHYKQRTVANTDFRKFDGTLRMVIDISREKLDELRDFLDSERRAGRLVFGIHSQDAALMTCMVRDYKHNHIHFVDGASGGYALAALELKKQLAGD